jgi:hypothetical protein
MTYRTISPCCVVLCSNGPRELNLISGLASAAVRFRTRPAKMRILTIIAAITASLCSATAQYYNPRTVRTFSRPDPAAIARDRAVMAAQDRAKRVAWAEYQAQLRSQRNAVIQNLKASAELENSRRTKAAELENKRKAEAAAKTEAASKARERKMEGLMQERATLRDTPNRTTSQEFFSAVRELRWRIGFGIVFGGIISVLVGLYFKASVRNPEDWRLGAVVLGCISLVMGSFALLSCWVPLLGLATLPSSVIACALAGIGWAIGRRAVGCETVLPLIAGFVSLLAIAGTLFVHAFLHQMGNALALN